LKVVKGVVFGRGMRLKLENRDILITMKPTCFAAQTFIKYNFINMCGLHSTGHSGFSILLKSNYIIMKRHLLLLLCFLIAISCQRSKIVTYDAPGQEKKSDDFEMFVNNKPVFVYQARVSKYPINQIWPGYQRPLNQTEIASFAYFDFQGEVDIKITSNKEIKTLDIRPKEYGIKATIKGNSIEFKLTKPSQFVVEVNGYHKALHIFANPVETYKIDKKDPKVHYFGPGIHEAGVINVKSDEDLITIFAYPATAGHDYATIETKGFRKLIIEKDGKPAIVDNPKWK